MQHLVGECGEGKLSRGRRSVRAGDPASRVDGTPPLQAGEGAPAPPTTAGGDNQGVLNWAARPLVAPLPRLSLGEHNPAALDMGDAQSSRAPPGDVRLEGLSSGGLHDTGGASHRTPCCKDDEAAGNEATASTACAMPPMRVERGRRTGDLKGDAMGDAMGEKKSPTHGVVGEAPAAVGKAKVSCGRRAETPGWGLSASRPQHGLETGVGPALCARSNWIAESASLATKPVCASVRTKWPCIRAAAVVLEACKSMSSMAIQRPTSG
mmetsp:Transcript_51862/g.150935  ORF Transcript_51862/g.150935 Transcript_51862/m.150935 type:complete len:266 (-) Transcript_51862:393-1190(-)